MIHLYMNRCYDEAEVWCGDPGYFKCEADGQGGIRYLSKAEDDPSKATCLSCLSKAASFGEQAADRLTDHARAAASARRREDEPEHEPGLDYFGHPTLLQIRIDRADRPGMANALVAAMRALRAAGFSVLPHARAKTDGGDFLTYSEIPE